MPAGSSLSGRRILIMEDEYLLADDLRRALQTLGVETVGPFPTLQKAENAASQDLDCAILDLNLQGELTFGMARRLEARGVPVVFVSGYDGAAIPEEFRETPRHAKPVDMDALLRRLEAMIGGAAPGRAHR